MNDDEKTKDQLLKELKVMRERLSELEEKQITPTQRANRESIYTNIEFIGDFDIIEAKGINISEGGICFLLNDPLAFEMRFELNGSIERHRGQLKWVKKVENEGYHYGFKFVQTDENSTIPTIS